jgi:parvulin-like peptidyl-prolyl isomerase
LPPILGLEPDPAAEPRELAAPSPQAAALGLLVRTGASRDREAARTLAGALAVKARSKGADFAALAREWSEDPASKARGAFLGTIRSKKDLDAHERILVKIQVGGVAGPIETSAGFWIVKRIPLEALAFDEIVFKWAGLPGAEANALDKDATRSLVNDWVQAATKKLENFDDVAARLSKGDVKSGRPPGAVAPVFRGDLIEAVESALRGLDIGGIAGPIETPGGYVVVRRAAVEWATFDSFLIQFRGAEGAPLKQVRSRDEARERAQAILTEAKASGAEFSKLAAAYSDNPADKHERIRRTLPVGHGSPGWLRDVVKLAVGDAGLAESAFGFHVVKRVAADVE